MGKEPVTEPVAEALAVAEPTTADKYQLPQEAKDWKVGHVFPHRSWGGAEIQMLDIAQWQTEAGIDVTVWCTSGSPIHEDALKRNLKCITNPVPLDSPVPPLWNLVPVVKRNRFTHLHLHWASGIRVFLGIKLFCKVRLIFYTHMWITRNKKDLLHALCYRQIDRWSVSGRRAKEAVLEHLPVRADQLDLVSYGLDFRKIPHHLRSNGKPVPGLRTTWGLPKDALVFAFFGRIDRQKGLSEFVQALGPLLNEFADLHLLIVGSPTLNEPDAETYSDEVDALIAALPDKNRIHRFPHQADFQPLLACADLLILPSYKESYSILIAHSFALGIPVVSTDSGGTPDLVNPPLRGWLVPPKTIEELRTCVRKIAQAPVQIWEKTQACLDYALANHSHVAVIERFVRMYRG